MEAVIQQYPHIIKQIYLPYNYAAIILSGIVSSPANGPIATTLSIGFELHLPYHTKDGSNTSLLVAGGPDVALNIILGLPFIKAMGMIVHLFVDNICEAKYLCSSPFSHQLQALYEVYPCFQDNCTHMFINASNRKESTSLACLMPSFPARKKGITLIL
jgi:hypothetical protein